MGHNGLDLSKDYHEDGWSGEELEYAHLEIILHYREANNGNSTGFTFDGSYVVGGSDEGEDHKSLLLNFLHIN